jgi:hypothetical protein
VAVHAQRVAKASGELEIAHRKLSYELDTELRRYHQEEQKSWNQLKPDMEKIKKEFENFECTERQKLQNFAKDINRAKRKRPISNESPNSSMSENDNSMDERDIYNVSIVDSNDLNQSVNSVTSLPPIDDNVNDQIREVDEMPKSLNENDDTIRNGEDDTENHENSDDDDRRNELMTEEEIMLLVAQHQEIERNGELENNELDESTEVPNESEMNNNITRMGMELEELEETNSNVEANDDDLNYEWF